MHFVLRTTITIWLIALAMAPSTSAQPEPQLGSINFPTSGSPKAQAHFLKGVAWLHSFGYLDAIEEFEKAQTIQPDFAMAYWGEAMANNQSVWYTQDTDAARRALTRLGPTPAARAARARTPREQAYLATVEVLYGRGDKPARDLAYEDAMRRLHETYPDDDEATVFYALAMLATQGRQAIIEDTRLKAGALAEAVFKRNPNHPGAAHLVIHAYDDPDHATRALDAARSYARIAPSASHALHMPSHIFLQLGLWDEAAKSDAASYAASDAWVKRRKLSLASRDYHSLSWLQYEYLQLGRYREAKEALKPLEDALKEKLGGSIPDGEHSDLNSSYTSEGRGVRLLAQMRARYVIETRRWNDVKGQPSFDSVDELFAVGMASAILGDFGRADETLQLLRQQVSNQQGVEKLIDSVQEREMDAMIRIAHGKTDEGIALLQEAGSLEDQIPGPVGLPFPVKRARELLGEVLLGSGRAQEAADQFQLALARTSNRTLSILGLARAYARLGDTARAREQYQRVLDIWRQADADLPELQEARSAMAGTFTTASPTAGPVQTGSGSSSSMQSMPISVRLAIAFLVVGGVAFLFVRRRRASTQPVASTRGERRRQSRQRK
jgi:tetratricopeptide (TPR) repeat protein